MFDPVKLKFAQYSQRSFHQVPPELQSALQSWQTATTETPDLQVFFVMNLAEMQAAISEIAQSKQLTATGYLYLIYPKLSSKKYTGIHRDSIFPYLKVNEATGEVAATGLKFSRMVSFDEDFTVMGLKWLTGNQRATSAASQRGQDYVSFLPKIKQRLATETPANAEFFQTLAPGYQRDWARYLYSPKTSATRERHYQIFLTALAAHYPNYTHYQKQQH
ncbi:YdeI/OmpD-associated family protein [Lapidilactobacillus wuchangensis]|uniref:YdeI/OmpD-associated family protein n=1 Tax=Lapidilactobacillus wuchangensis TaxID=2486001 RepID=UPI000F785990|nr:YdeI/OmpD-associated family protein [Lapidilactobacillus wuchangensis]